MKGIKSKAGISSAGSSVKINHVTFLVKQPNLLNMVSDFQSCSLFHQCLLNIMLRMEHVIKLFLNYFILRLLLIRCRNEDTILHNTTTPN